MARAMMAAQLLRDLAMVAMTKNRPLAAAPGVDQACLLTAYNVPSVSCHARQARDQYPRFVC